MNWSERLDDRIRQIMRRIPEPPLWALGGMMLGAAIFALGLWIGS